MMLLIAIIVVIFGLIFLLDLPLLIRTNQRTKTFIVYFLILGSAFTLSILLTIDRAPTNPSILIEKMVKFILPGQ